jgi:hypothetical protein
LVYLVGFKDTDEVAAKDLGDVFFAVASFQQFLGDQGHVGYIVEFTGR